MRSVTHPQIIKGEAIVGRAFRILLITAENYPEPDRSLIGLYQFIPDFI
jgi:hypothetical protein